MGLRQNLTSLFQIFSLTPRSHSQGRPDPSLPKPHTAYGKAGAEVGEPEGDVVTDSPGVLLDLNRFEDAMFNLGLAGFSDDTLDSVRQLLSQKSGSGSGRGDVVTEPSVPQAHVEPQGS